MRFLKVDILLILLIILLSWVSWNHITSLQFTGEGWGFIGTVPPKGNVFEIVAQELGSLDEFTSDRIMSGVLLPIFKDQIELYMWLQFAYMLFIASFLYFLVFNITKNRLTAFLSTLFFSTSHLGNFETYSSGGYLYFAQRAVLVAPLLLAIYFLYLYLTQKFNFLYYLFSFSSYLFALIMGFYSTYFTALFIFYPIVFFLCNFKNFKNYFFKLVWVPLPFLVVTLKVIEGSRAFTNESVFSYLFTKFPYVTAGIIQQLSVLTFPIGEILFKFNKLSVEFVSIMIITVCVYFYALIAILKDYNTRIFAVSVFLTLLAMLFFNVYLQSAETLNTHGSSRYFYFPSVMISIFWGIFASRLFRSS